MEPHFIDLPSSWAELPECLIVKGWCFGADGQPIQALRLRTNTLCFSGIVGLPRPDVRVALPHAPNDFTGFYVRAILPCGQSLIIIEAQYADGIWRPIIEKIVRVRRQWRPRWMTGSNWTQLMFFQMPGHMLHPARTLKAERFPRPHARGKTLPRLSLVTPSLQQIRFLGTTVRSVLEQHEDFDEYIVQDGGSTDGSVESLRETAASISNRKYAQSFRWISEPDAGQADAISRAFSQTRGAPADLMAWINSDDFYHHGALAYVRSYFMNHPEVDVIYGHRILVDECGREIGRWFLPPHDDEVLRHIDFVPQETMFWRRRIWDKVRGINPLLKFAMDWDLLLRFQAANAKIVRVPYFLASFRIHSAQKTTSQMEQVGQKEIDSLRLRTFGRVLPAAEIENHPRLLRFLRKSAWIEFLWRRFGIRHR